MIRDGLMVLSLLIMLVILLKYVLHTDETIKAEKYIFFLPSILFYSFLRT